jgi:hypothetical protein
VLHLASDSPVVRPQGGLRYSGRHRATTTPAASAVTGRADTAHTPAVCTTAVHPPAGHTEAGYPPAGHTTAGYQPAGHTSAVHTETGSKGRGRGRGIRIALAVAAGLAALVMLVPAAPVAADLLGAGQHPAGLQHSAGVQGPKAEPDPATSQGPPAGHRAASQRQHPVRRHSHRPVSAHRDRSKR